MRCAQAICKKILGAFTRKEAARWWTSVPMRATAACWYRVGTVVNPRALSSIRLAREASKMYRALSLASSAVTWSRRRALSESSAMKGATYYPTPPGTAMITSWITLGGTTVLRQ